MEKEYINVYNHFHNGDVFYSRVLIKVLSQKFKINFYHILAPGILCDIDDLTEIRGIPSNYQTAENNFDEKIVNSWMGQCGYKYVNLINEGCTFENYIEICRTAANHYDIEIPSEEELFPEIDYDKVPNIESVKNNLDNLLPYYKKSILICNGNVLSYQSENFDFTNIVNILSSDFPNVLFLVTQKIESPNKNVVYCGDITQTYPDLLQISYISTKIETIVGRASGPYCFTQIKENLLNPEKTYIIFSNIETEGKYFNNQKSKTIWSNDYDEKNVIITIKNHLA